MKINKRKYEVALARAGLTADDLQSLGVRQVTIWNILQRGGEARPKTVGKIAKALGVDVTEIIDMD